MRDVDKIIAEIRRRFPQIWWKQLEVTHPGADDDGLWFFRLPSGTNEVQIESPDGTCPFLVEHNASNERFTGDSVEAVVSKVVEWLQIEIPQDIEAVLNFLRAEEGGRTRPVFTGYRPQFYYGGEDWDAAHTFLGVEQVNRGETVTAQLKFFRPQNHVGRIAVGMEFQLREGKRCVATGRVTKILHLDENAAKVRN
jgi:elongation factor Tu